MLKRINESAGDINLKISKVLQPQIEASLDEVLYPEMNVKCMFDGVPTKYDWVLTCSELPKPRNFKGIDVSDCDWNDVDCVEIESGCAPKYYENIYRPSWDDDGEMDCIVEWEVKPGYQRELHFHYHWKFNVGIYNNELTAKMVEFYMIPVGPLTGQDL